MVQKLSAAVTLAALLASATSKLSLLSPMSLQGKFVGKSLQVTPNRWKYQGKLC